MNEFFRCRRDCQLGIKAYQNIHSSLQALKRLCDLIDSDDRLYTSSMFYMGVIRYAKPFESTRTGKGDVCYQLKWLTKMPDFSVDVHKHLITLRRTLIAHDDFTQIEPRIVGFSLGHEGVSDRLVTSLIISNKCVACPIDRSSTEKIRDHISIALKGVLQKLCEDLGRLRDIERKHPDQARQAQKYYRDCGKIEIPKEGTRLTQPDVSGESWLDIPDPDFSAVHNGFRYEEVKVRVNFHGPDEIRLPDGGSLRITP